MAAIDEARAKIKNAIFLKQDFLNLIDLGLTNEDLSVLILEIAIVLPQLKELNLDENNLNALPSNITDLKNLEVLSLYNNKLGTVGAALVSLPDIAELNLGSNGFNVLPDIIFQLKNTKKLNLSENNLRTISDKIGQLKQLTHLDLSGNLLRNLPKTFVDLIKLSDLKLCNNLIEFFPSALTSLPLLRTLDLSQNKLRGLPTEFGKNLAFPESIEVFDEVCTVHLEENPLTQDYYDKFQSLGLEDQKLNILVDDFYDRTHTIKNLLEIIYTEPDSCNDLILDSKIADILETIELFESDVYVLGINGIFEILSKSPSEEKSGTEVLHIFLASIAFQNEEEKDLLVPVLKNLMDAITTDDPNAAIQIAEIAQHLGDNENSLSAYLHEKLIALSSPENTAIFSNLMNIVTTNLVKQDILESIRKTIEKIENDSALQAIFSSDYFKTPLSKIVNTEQFQQSINNDLERLKLVLQNFGNEGNEIPTKLDKLIFKIDTNQNLICNEKGSIVDSAKVRQIYKDYLFENSRVAIANEFVEAILQIIKSSKLFKAASLHPSGGEYELNGHIAALKKDLSSLPLNSVDASLQEKIESVVNKRVEIMKILVLGEDALIKTSNLYKALAARPLKNTSGDTRAEEEKKYVSKKATKSRKNIIT